MGGQGPEVVPKRGLAALEDLYAPFTANITLHIDKYTFRAHREYLGRSPRLARTVLASAGETLTLALPVPSKFMDCLTFLYVGGGPAALAAFHEGLFTPSNFLDTLRNAIYLELDEIVNECYRRCAFLLLGDLCNLEIEIWPITDSIGFGETSFFSILSQLTL